MWIMSNKNVDAGKIPLMLPTEAHAKIVERILEGGDCYGKRALVIHCSHSLLSQSLKAFGLEAWEINLSAQATATSSVDWPFQGTQDAFFTSHGLNTGKFDYLVFSDGLPHTADPGDTLRQCRSLLKPDGCVIFSIRNIANICPRPMPQDITIRAVVALLTDSAFRFESLECVQVPRGNAGLDAPPSLLARGQTLIQHSGVDNFQYVVMGRNRGEAMSMADIAANKRIASGPYPRILVLVPYFELGLANIRMVQPLGAWMRRHGGHVRFMKFADIQLADIQGIDMVVIQRVISPLALKLIGHMQDRGIKVIFDIDDLLTEIPAYLTSSAALQQQLPLLKKILHRVDGITVTTQRLSEKLSPYNRCHVTPNCPAPLPTPCTQQRGQGLITLLMASSDSVRVDFIVSALKELLAHYPDQLRLVAIGPPGDFLLAQGIFVEHVAAMDYLGFRQFIASQTDAIGIIPLDDTPFGSCKSAIKFMDYALAGIPSVCSAVAPYSDVVRNGENGLLADNTHASWYGSIARLCNSPELRNALAAQARRDVQTDWSLAHAADAWQAVLNLHINREGHSSALEWSVPQRAQISWPTNYLPRLRALLWTVDMQGGWLQFLHRIRYLWRTEGVSGLRRRISAFRSREL